jgi:hypothetical protein
VKLGGKGGGKGAHKGNVKRTGRKDVSSGTAKNAKGKHAADKKKGNAGGGGEGRGPKGDE